MKVMEGRKTGREKAFSHCTHDVEGECTFAGWRVHVLGGPVKSVWCLYQIRPTSWWGVGACGPG